MTVSVRFDTFVVVFQVGLYIRMCAFSFGRGIYVVFCYLCASHVCRNFGPYNLVLFDDLILGVCSLIN